MTVQDLVHIIKTPYLLHQYSLLQLDNLLLQYPYFSTLHVLVAKKMQLENHQDYENTLTVASAYSSDKKRLFDFIENEKCSTSAVANAIKTSNQTDQVEDIFLTLPVDDRQQAPSLSRTQSDKILELAYVSMDYTSLLQAEKQQSLASLLVSQNQAKNTNITSLHRSYSDWLSTYATAPIESKKPNAVKRIAGKFVKGTPPIKTSQSAVDSSTITKKLKDKIDDAPLKKVMLSDEENKKIIETAHKSLVDDIGLVSETLAKINIAQGNIAKAKKMFEKLMLQYPEKSRYFAELIKNLKKN